MPDQAAIVGSPARPTWIDSHCHLYDERLPGGAVAAVAAAHEAGVVQMITVGCDEASSRTAIDHAAMFDQVYATVGLHPHDAINGVDSIRPLLSTAGLVGVGECGLDYHYDHSPRDVQRAVFAEQIQLAHELDLTLVIHTREAWEETFTILDAEGVPRRTVFHCFTGGADEAVECVARGAYLSFSGIVTFPSATDVQAAARACPLDRLLVETDSPYLAPVPYRGKRNQPAFVVAVGESVARLRGIDAAELAASTRGTTVVAFGLPDA
jgi:TatD DNase family protein